MSLTWENNSWQIAADIAVRQRGLTAPFAITVLDPKQLPAALAQREKPIAIENVAANKTLIQALNLFQKYQFWWLIGGTLAYAIYQGYGIELSRTQWRGPITIQDKIILTPNKDKH